jgi:hypothetical protein
MSTSPYRRFSRRNNYGIALPSYPAHVLFASPPPELGFERPPKILNFFINLRSEVAPEPPFLETDLRPVDHARRAPGPRFGNSKRRPSGWISGSICGGASSAECQQSYRMKPEIDRSSFTSDLNRQIMRQHIGFLVGDAAGFGCRHVGTVADGVDVLPLGF